MEKKQSDEEEVVGTFSGNWGPTCIFPPKVMKIISHILTTEKRLMWLGKEMEGHKCEVSLVIQ